MNESAYQGNDEIDLRDIFISLWANRKILSGITGVAAGMSLVLAIFLNDVYRAEAVLISAEEQQTSSGFDNQYSGAAAILGVNIGDSSRSKINTAIAVMNSREFIGRFIDNHDVLVPLFAGTWNVESASSAIDSAIYDQENDRWLWSDGEPTRLEAIREFREVLSISGPERDTGIITVSIEWHDPRLATNWVNQFVADINSDIKQRDVREATNAITYLSNQLGSTQLVEMQRAFYQLIESQTRITMLADVRDEYVFRVIDPAVVPDRKVAPQRLMIVAIGTATGVLAALVFLFFRGVLRRA